MSKKRFIIYILLLIVGFTPYLTTENTYAAIRLTIPINRPTSISGVSFNILQQSTIKALNTAIKQIENAKNKIAVNTKITDATKQVVFDSLNNVENILLNYKNKVAAATSIDELKALNQEIIQLLKDNKDVIRKNYKKVIIDLGNQAVQKTEELKKKVEQLLTVLKITCPAQKQIITNLESQLTQLENEIAVLKSAIQSQDATAIKNEIKNINSLSQQIAANLKIIKQECLR